jgi:large subunit ribosomal protein L29
MKTKDLSALRTKEKEELIKMLSERRLEAAKAKAEIKAGTQKNLKKVTNLRREIAVILTVLTEKKFLEEEKQAKEVKEEK